MIQAPTRSDGAKPSAALRAPSALLQRKCACGGNPGAAGECAACRKKKLTGGATLQKKLAIGSAHDPAEREADRVADTVMRMASPGAETGGAVQPGITLQRRSDGGAGGVGEAPPIVHNVLSSPGRPLDAGTRGFMEPRFGTDLSHVRVHSDARAAESAQAVNATAYTVGNNVVFGRGAYAPGSDSGRRLLAHELAHVGQQGGTPNSSHVVRRFTSAERGDIADLDSVIDTARDIADRRGLWGMMRWGRFTAGAGASGLLEAVRPESGSLGGLTNRYLFTCRCGLIDMRHFYQLMYIALLPFSGGNRGATDRGRKHELDAEESSRFAPEDTTSNALGAFFGSRQSVSQRQKTFLGRLRKSLGVCDPVDFSTLPASEQNAIVDYYSRRDASGRPANAAEAAAPAVLPATPCAGRNRSAPFETDPSDPDKKTIKRLL